MRLHPDHKSVLALATEPRDRKNEGFSRLCFIIRVKVSYVYFSFTFLG